MFVLQTAPPLLSLLQGTTQRNAVTKRMAARTDIKKLSQDGIDSMLFGAQVDVTSY